MPRASTSQQPVCYYIISKQKPDHCPGPCHAGWGGAPRSPHPLHPIADTSVGQPDTACWHPFDVDQQSLRRTICRFDRASLAGRLYGLAGACGCVRPACGHGLRGSRLDQSGALPLCVVLAVLGQRGGLCPSRQPASPDDTSCTIAVELVLARVIQDRLTRPQWAHSLDAARKTRQTLPPLCPLAPAARSRTRQATVAEHQGCWPLRAERAGNGGEKKFQMSSMLLAPFCCSSCTRRFALSSCNSALLQ